MTEHVRRRHGGPRVPLLAMAILLFAAGLLMVWGGINAPTDAPEQPRPPPAASAAAIQVPNQVPTRVPKSAPGSNARSASGGRPESMVVPALGVDAAVASIQLEGSALTPPADPQAVGWWSQGARPGGATGSAVFTGHTVHTGGGAFDDLDQLAPGDEMVVRTDRGPLAYEVVSVRVLERDELARRSAEIFDQSGPARLVVITCEDWDGTAYRSNVVVIARPAV